MFIRIIVENESEKKQEKTVRLKRLKTFGRDLSPITSKNRAEVCLGNQISEIAHKKTGNNEGRVSRRTPVLTIHLQLERNPTNRVYVFFWASYM
jgi:hypothetical protein